MNSKVKNKFNNLSFITKNKIIKFLGNTMKS